MFSSIWNDTSVSGNRRSRACPSGMPKCPAISPAKSGCALPAKTFSSPKPPSCRHPRALHAVVPSGSSAPQLAGAEGFEPSNTGSKVPCLTTWPRPIPGVFRHRKAQPDRRARKQLVSYESGRSRASRLRAPVVGTGPTGALRRARGAGPGYPISTPAWRRVAVRVTIVRHGDRLQAVRCRSWRRAWSGRARRRWSRCRSSRPAPRPRPPAPGESRPVRGDDETTGASRSLNTARRSACGLRLALAAALRPAGVAPPAARASRAPS